MWLRVRMRVCVCVLEIVPAHVTWWQKDHDTGTNERQWQASTHTQQQECVLLYFALFCKINFPN